MMKRIAKFSAIFIIILVAIFVFYNKYSNRVKFQLLEYGSMDQVIHAKGMVFKKDKITRFNSGANSKFYFNEGDKISSGVKVVDLNISGYNEILVKQIELISNAIDENSSLVVIEPDKNNYYSQYSDGELDVLLRRYENALDKGSIDFYSRCSGFLSYKYDGFEDICSLDVILDDEKLDDFDFSILDKINNENTDIVETPPDFLFKVSENFEYYIALKANNEDILNLRKGMFLKVELNKNASVYGQIFKLMPSNKQEEQVLILKFDDYFYKIYDKRIIDTVVITETFQGLVVPNESMVELNDTVGVYIVDVSKIVKFLPVDILYSDKYNTIVSVGEALYEGGRGVIKIADKSFSTVMRYDKIVLNPLEVYDGKIIEREWKDDN